MLDAMEAVQEITNGLLIGTMSIDVWCPWTAVLQCHQNCTSNVSNMMTNTMMRVKRSRR